MKDRDEEVEQGGGRDTSALQAALGYRFRDASLLETALCHSSYAHDHGELQSNERLEFLGDSVLGMVVAHSFFEAHPDWAEGDLTRGLASLVEGSSLAELGQQLDIGSHLLLGRTELQSAGHTKASVLENATEAVIAAMYLDGGLEPVFGLIRRVFAEALVAGAPRVQRHPKTALQELVVSRHGEFPCYELVRDSEVSADPLRFSCSVTVLGETWGQGEGRTKQAAERAAAEQALSERAADLGELSSG